MTQPFLFENVEPFELTLYQRVHSVKSEIEREMLENSDNLSPHIKSFLKDRIAQVDSITKEMEKRYHLETYL